MTKEELKEKLTVEELEKVNGGINDTSDNPKGLKPGDSVYFYYDHLGDWMWGYFVDYDGKYRVRWNETNIMCAGQIDTIKAGETWVSEQYIK